MASEIDPILVRALNLLHSKHPKALEQLCALRDEVLGKKPESIPEVGKCRRQNFHFINMTTLARLSGQWL